ncbi:hypothetical protein ACH5RR_016716 [Cinchona calisaya]|uniref:Uncharacterized protein n=1 Tax=Cinchona calisaya TaxID=153742 RepID=A0ABD2ZWR1_9GENT
MYDKLYTSTYKEHILLPIEDHDTLNIVFDVAKQPRIHCLEFYLEAISRNNDLQGDTLPMFDIGPSTELVANEGRPLDDFPRNSDVYVRPRDQLPTDILSSYHGIGRSISEDRHSTKARNEHANHGVDNGSPKVNFTSTIEEIVANESYDFLLHGTSINNNLLKDEAEGEDIELEECHTKRHQLQNSSTLKLGGQRRASGQCFTPYIDGKISAYGIKASGHEGKYQKGIQTLDYDIVAYDYDQSDAKIDTEKGDVNDMTLDLDSHWKLKKCLNHKMQIISRKALAAQEATADFPCQGATIEVGDYSGTIWRLQILKWYDPEQCPRYKEVINGLLNSMSKKDIEITTLQAKNKKTTIIDSLDFDFCAVFGDKDRG